MMTRTAMVAVTWVLLGSATNVAEAQLVRGDPPPFMLGHFVDDYGIPYSITRDAWGQGREGEYIVVEWDPQARWALVRSSSASTAGPDRWTRIDWVELGGPDDDYPWAFCYASYDQPDAEAARAAPASRRSSPRTGCNGFPFSRMKRADEAVIEVGPPTLRVTMTGNAGVVLTDGTTSLLVDLPYESGASGYMRYDFGSLTPPGSVVSVVTHHHRDHFDPDLFVQMEGARLIGPVSVRRAVPETRVVAGDSVGVGDFSVIAIPTPHTDDHRSYRVRWRGRVLHFVGDTEVATHLGLGPAIDVLFITPWLSCTATAQQLARATRRIAYHESPRDTDRICGGVESLAQGTSFVLQARRR